MPALSAYFYSTLYTLLQGENLPLFFLEERKEKKEEKKPRVFLPSHGHSARAQA